MARFLPFSEASALAGGYVPEDKPAKPTKPVEQHTVPAPAQDSRWVTNAIGIGKSAQENYAQAGRRAASGTKAAFAGRKAKREAVQAMTPEERQTRRESVGEIDRSSIREAVRNPAMGSPAPAAKQDTRRNPDFAAKAAADKETVNQFGHLDKTVSPGLRGSANDEDVPVSGSTHREVWDLAQKHLNTLESHFANLPNRITQRGAEYSKAADAVESVFHGPKGTLNVGGSHPGVNALRESAKFLGEQGATRSVREHLTVKNNLTEARALLNSLKTDELGKPISSSSKFREFQGANERQQTLDKVVGLLRGAHKSLNNGVLKPHGIGSPLSDSDVKGLAYTSNQVAEKAGVPKLPNPKDINNRDIDMGIARMSKDEKGNDVLENPKEALADPGHVWVGERVWENPKDKSGPGVRDQVEATQENLDEYTARHGKGHRDVLAIKGMIKKLQRPMSTKVRFRKDAGLPVDQKNATTGKEVGAGPSLGTPAKKGKGKTLTDAQKAATATGRTRARDVSAMDVERNPTTNVVMDRTAPEQLTNAHKLAVGHIQSGRPLPRELRKVLGASGVAKAMREAQAGK